MELGSLHDFTGYTKCNDGSIRFRDQRDQKDECRDYACVCVCVCFGGFSAHVQR